MHLSISILCTATIVLLVALLLACLLFNGGTQLKVAPPPVQYVQRSADDAVPHPPLTLQEIYEQPKTQSMEQSRIALPSLIRDVVMTEQTSNSAAAAEMASPISTPNLSALSVQAQQEWKTHWAEWQFPKAEWVRESHIFANKYHAAHRSSTEGPLCIQEWKSNILNVLIFSLQKHLQAWNLKCKNKPGLSIETVARHLSEPPWTKSFYLDPRAHRLNLAITNYILLGGGGLLTSVIQECKEFYATKNEEEKENMPLTLWCEELNTLEEDQQRNKQIIEENPLARYLSLCLWYGRVHDLCVPGHHMVKDFYTPSREEIITVHQIWSTVVKPLVDTTTRPDVFSSRPLEQSIADGIIKVIAGF